ncbi:MAG: IS3 family transposase, partial [Bdellovibrionota bacterium]
MTLKYELSVKCACRLVGLYESTRYYKSKRVRSDEELKLKIREATSLKTRWGRPRIVWYLRTVMGITDNHKRIGRVYRELGLQIGKRKGKKRMRTHTLVPIHKPVRRGVNRPPTPSR